MDDAELTPTQESKLEGQDWFNGLIDDCDAIMTEKSLESRMAFIEGYHLLGKRISEEKGNFERAEIYGQKIVQCIAKSLGKSERTVQYAVQFYEKFPDLALLPEGKNLSWSLITQKYLPKTKNETTPEQVAQKPIAIQNLLSTTISFTISELMLLIHDNKFSEFDDLLRKRVRDTLGVEDLSPIGELYVQEKTKLKYGQNPNSNE